VGRDKRRFNRLSVTIPVVMRRGHRDESLVTGDISRHGAFVLTDHPLRERELVQLKFQPNGAKPFEIMCMVTRSLPPGSERGPGMGVDFFAMSREIKDRWDRYVLALERELGTPPEGVSRPASVTPPPLPPDALDEEDEDIPAVVGQSLIAPPVRREHPRERACFLVRLEDEARMEEFLTRDVSRGGMFLETPLRRDVGESVMLVLIHPATSEEFDLKGTVMRLEDDGMGIRFEGLNVDRLGALEDFFHTGVQALDVRDHPELEKLHAAEAEAHKLPDEPDVLESLGRERLKNSDLPGAIEALTAAVTLAPSMVSLHELLARAYYEAGDVSRGRGHERVALSLGLYRSEVDNALG
jgi:Tfp pilus assembly protein PilZ